ncbi:unnamed protein product, partial [Phaeothamnion confervicola]
ADHGDGGGSFGTGDGSRTFGGGAGSGGDGLPATSAPSMPITLPQIVAMTSSPYFGASSPTSPAPCTSLGGGPAAAVSAPGLLPGTPDARGSGGGGLVLTSRPGPATPRPHSLL